MNQDPMGSQYGQGRRRGGGLRLWVLLAFALYARNYRMQDLNIAAGNAARVRAHLDGHQVPMRALPDYDDLYGVNFTTTTDLESHN